jgi:acid phosphatase
VAAEARAADTAAASGPTITKVLTIVEENHSLSEARAGMPYLSALGDRYGYATHYRAIRHPSLPNYLAIIGGDTFGVADDAGPAAHRIRGATVFGQALKAGKTARVYAESIPAPCEQTGSGRYAVRHAPWPYFASETAQCKADDVATGPLASGRLHDDIRSGKLPNAGLVAPNLCDDAHDCSLGQADAWLRQLLPQILAGPDFRSGHLAVVITSDEDDSAGNNTVLTVVLAPGLDHRVVRTPLTHYSLTGFYDAVLGTPLLRNAAKAPSLAKAFGLRVPSR